ncbi:MAG TPA: hypothetical protein VHL79_04205 [Ramlibacter sp.]|jgi:hypothetical protein|nr:hypothetical protein [Ramlibacter sp.]
MRQQSWPLVTLAAACLLALGACSKQAETNPVAPGSPGTGNSTEVVRPSAPDGPPGGPSGIAGSAPHTGSSGGDVLPGTSGRGTNDVTARSQTVEPGSGLNGGLGTGTSAVMGAAPSAEAPTSSAPTGSGPGSTPGGSGSSNTSSRDAVGRR